MSGVAVSVSTWYGVVFATTVVQPVVPPVVQEIVAGDRADSAAELLTVTV